MGSGGNMGQASNDVTYLQHTATHRNTQQHTATHCNTLQHSATRCDTWGRRQMTLLTYSTLQHTAAHRNTLQHTTTQHMTLLTYRVTKTHRMP